MQEVARGIDWGTSEQVKWWEWRKGNNHTHGQGRLTYVDLYCKHCRPVIVNN